MKTFSKSKIIILAVVIALALVFTGCKPVIDDVDTSPTPTMDDSPLDSTASPGTSGTTTGTPDANASPDVSGTPDDTTTPASGQAVIPAATDFAPLDPDYGIAQNLAAIYKNCDYAVIVTIDEELGARNIMEGTDLGKTLPNAVLNYWEYNVTVTEVLKSSKTEPIEVNTQIVLSQPFEIKMKSSEPLSREESFVQLEVGQSYVVLLTFEDYYNVYKPSATEPNLLKIDGDNLQYVSGVSSYKDLWKTIYGGDIITMSDFRKIAK